MSSGRISRAEQFLETAVRRDAISNSGRDWLISAIDPFHDRNLPDLCGFPDSQVGSSVTALVKQQFTYKRPVDVPDTGLWQCQIACYPWAFGDDAFIGEYELDRNTIYTIGLGNQNIWPVTAYASVDGTACGPFPETNSAHPSGVGIPSDFTNGPFRVIGWGVEVYNTTSDLYRQGTCTVYRQNCNPYRVESGNYVQPSQAFENDPDVNRVVNNIREYVTDSSDKFAATWCDDFPLRLKYLKERDPKKFKMFDVIEITPEYLDLLHDTLKNVVVDGSLAFAQCNGAFSFHRMRRHPQDVAEAMLLQNTRVWDAEKGVYMVCVMNEASNPAQMGNLVQPMILPEDNNIGQQNIVDSVYTLAGPHWNKTQNVNGTMLDPGYIVPEVCWGLQPYHMSGAFFTGLSPQTTLTVSVNWYVERFPTPDEAAILALAKPSANYDPIALEFYDRALCRMPVGVPVAENGFGDWFNGVVDQMSRYVTPIAKIIGGPIGNTVAQISEAAGNAASSNIAEAKRKKKKKKAKARMAGGVPPGPGVQTQAQRARVAAAQKTLNRNQQTRRALGPRPR